MNKLPLSVYIVAMNEESNIVRCLDAIKDIASEMIVVDSHSTDRTVEIAKSYGAKVFDEDWKGMIGQKNSALQKCTGEWAMNLDCDEVITPELRQSIIDALRDPKHEGYQINRKTFYLGKFIEHAWYPDWNLRLFRRTAGKHAGYEPHEVVRINGSVGKLAGDMHHYSFKDLRDHFTRSIKYAEANADFHLKNGKKASLAKLLFNPFYAFFKFFLFKMAFLDGIRGFIISVNVFFYTFMKYAFMWEKKNGRDKGQGAGNKEKL